MAKLFFYPDALGSGDAFITVEFAVAAGDSWAIHGADIVFVFLVKLFVKAAENIFSAGIEEEQKNGG